MEEPLETNVLTDALSKYPAPQIFNSDQDSQYTGNNHTAVLKEQVPQ
jgi:putative transposase